MRCPRCQRDLPDDARYCLGCGAAQSHADGPSRRLTRRPAHSWLGGVCAGLADYLDVDVTLVRAAWVVLSVVPGFIVGGFLAYLLAWLLIPGDTASDAAAPSQRTLTRSTTDKRIAGVCGGLAEHFGVDSTPIRLLWIVLSVVPGAIAGGLIVYGLAWVIMPKAAPAIVPDVEARTV